MRYIEAEAMVGENTKNVGEESTNCRGGIYVSHLCGVEVIGWCGKHLGKDHGDFDTLEIWG